MGHVELLSTATCQNRGAGLRFGSRSRSYCWTMLISLRSLTIRNHDLPKWKCLISFTINFSIQLIAWGTSLQPSSISDNLLHRLKLWQPQLLIVHSMNIQVERRPLVCVLKMNIEVHFVHPLQYIVLLKPLHLSITQEWAALNHTLCGTTLLQSVLFNSHSYSSV